MSGIDKFFQQNYLQDLVFKVWQSYGKSLDTPLSDRQIMLCVMVIEGVQENMAWIAVTNMWRKKLICLGGDFYFPTDLVTNSPPCPVQV